MMKQQQQLLRLDKKDKQSSSWLQHAHYRNTKRYFLFLLLSSIIEIKEASEQLFYNS